MDATAVYRLRAEECLALALETRDEVQREQSIEMAMYWFEQAETTPDAILVVYEGRRAKNGDDTMVSSPGPTERHVEG
jgi:hypothetical protein